MNLNDVRIGVADRAKKIFFSSLDFCRRFILLIIKNKKTKLAALAVAVLFFIFFFWWLGQKYYFDTLKKYVPEQSFLYAHFNLNNQPFINQVFIDQIMAAGYGIINTNDINREAAFVGLKPDKYALVFKSRDGNLMEKKLLENKINYYRLKKNIFLLADPKITAEFRNTEKNITTKIKYKFSLFNNISLFVGDDYFTAIRPSEFNDSWLKLFYSYFADQQGDLFLEFAIKKNELKISGQNKFTAQSRLVSGFDLLYSNRNLDLEIFNQQFFNSIHLDHTSSLSGKLASSSITVAIKNKNDFYISFGLKDSLIDREVADLERVLRFFISPEQQKIQKIKLDDGTTVSEIVTDLEKFQFTQDGEFKSIKIGTSSPASLYYYLTDDKLVITNVSSWLKLNLINKRGHFQMSSQYLPDSGFWHYGRQFNWLTLNNKYLILKY